MVNSNYYIILFKRFASRPAPTPPQNSSSKGMGVESHVLLRLPCVAIITINIIATITISRIACPATSDTPVRLRRAGGMTSLPCVSNNKQTKQQTKQNNKQDNKQNNNNNKHNTHINHKTIKTLPRISRAQASSGTHGHLLCPKRCSYRASSFHAVDKWFILLGLNKYYTV